MENLWLFAQEQIVLLAALCILIVAFLRRESMAAGSKLSLHEVVREMNTDAAVLLDVRDAKTFAQGHIANAVNIPHNSLKDNLAQVQKHREKRIIVTDAIGQQAGAAGKLLAQEGFNVARMMGGMSEWQQQGFPVVTKG